MPTKNKNYDKKIFRLLYILNKLDRGGNVLTNDLAKEFNVSSRTVQRDLELLNMAGFPLTPLAKGEHSFADGFSLKKLMLSKEEAARFFKAKKHLPLQKILKEEKDGSLVIETMVSHDMEVAPTVFLWLPYVRVISPKGLDDDIKGIIKDYLRPPKRKHAVHETG